MSWESVGICDSCWVTRSGDREPVRVAVQMRNTEKCHFCNRTANGIYVRTKVLEKEPRSITAPFKPSVEQ